jgi:hypothetical protein
MASHPQDTNPAAAIADASAALEAANAAPTNKGKSRATHAEDAPMHDDVPADDDEDSEDDDDDAEEAEDDDEDEEEVHLPSCSMHKTQY